MILGNTIKIRIELNCAVQPHRATSFSNLQASTAALHIYGWGQSHVIPLLTAFEVRAAAFEVRAELLLDCKCTENNNNCSVDAKIIKDFHY